MSSLLKLYSLRMQNYRNYKNVKLEFSQDLEKTITIFHGSMSAGKTTIMNAINWCLYNEETHFINEGEGKPLVNQKKLNETALGKSITTEVELIFSDEKGPRYKILRGLIGYRKTVQRNKIFNSLANGLVDAGFEFETEQRFSYIDSDSNDWEHIEEPDRVEFQVQRHIPQDLSNFIFFNGEMLDKFFSSLQSENIKIGIERVSGLDILKNAKKNLTKLESIYRKKASSNRTDTVSSELKLERITELRQKELEKLEQVNLQLQPLKREKIEINGVLSKYPEAVINELQEKLVKTEALIQSKNLLLERNRIDQRKYLIDKFAKMLLSKPIQSCLRILSNAEREGIIPPPIEYNFLQGIISNKRCICGRNFLENSSEKHELEKLLLKLFDSEIASESHQGKLFVSNDLLINISKSTIIEELDLFRNQRRKIEEEIEGEKGSKIQTLKILQQYPIEEIRKKGKLLEELDIKIQDLENEIYLSNQNIEKYDNAIKDTKSIIDEATREDENSRIWNTRKELTVKLIEYIDKLYQDTLDEIRLSVEKHTNQIFAKLISRRWQLDRIEISQEYKIKVLDKEGVNNLRTLSAGQTLYLSLSFISALRKITSINYPMVIDSPFGKVSGNERIWAAQDIPTFLPNTQITFLVTDTEYSSAVSNIMTNEKLPSIRDVLLRNEKVWQEFNLIMVKDDDISSRTEIQKVDI